MDYKRVVIDRYGGQEVLRIVEEPVPEPRRGQARVRVLHERLGEGSVTGKIVLVCSQ